MTPNIAPMMTPVARSFKCNDGAPFHTTIICSQLDIKMQYRQDSSGDGKVDGHHLQTGQQALLPFQHGIFGRHKYGSGAQTSKHRSDNPRGKNLSESMPPPINAVNSKSCNANSNDRADDSM